MTEFVSSATVRRKKHSMLPLLVFLFVVCWGMLTTLVVLEERRIGAQTDLIHLLFQENHRLNVIAGAGKSHAIAENKTKSQSSAQVPSPQVGKAQSPSAQVAASPKTSEIPSSQEKKQAKTKADRTHHQTGRRSPFQPPKEVTDPYDMRRTVFSI
jgi:hypothetical protein